MRAALLVTLGAASIAAAADSPLPGTKWELIDPVTPAGSSRRAPVLSFENKGRFGLRVCNSISGPVQFEETRLVVKEQPISTMMACPGDNGQLEQSLTTAVAKNKSFLFEGERLTLIGPSDETFVFRKLLAPSADATTKFVYVASTLAECTGIMKMKCLQVRESKNEPWKLFYSPILGFEHVPGIEYRLRIKEDKVPNPPADASSIRWFLDAVIEQTVVDRKAADDYQASKRKP